jgi:hypothetical protein
VKIYEVKQDMEYSTELDPRRGVVKKGTPILTPSGTHQITFGNATYDANHDMTFDVPEEVGKFLVHHQTGQTTWHEGRNPFYAESKEAALKQAVADNLADEDVTVDEPKRTRSRK